MFIISKTFKFEAAHRLVDHDGKCAQLHGHSYTFKLEVRGPLIGGGVKRNMVCDYSDLGDAGKELESFLDHQFLNEAIGEDMVTAEFLSRWIYELVSHKVPDLWAVQVSETENTSCRYCPIESRIIQLGEETLFELRKRLFESVKIGECDECWPFMGSKDKDGYGYCMGRPAGTNRAHRLSAWLAGIEIEGKEVLHSCDNPACCNPSHLSAGTHDDNERDKDQKGRRPKGEDQGSAILTNEIVRNLWDEYVDAGKPKGYAYRQSIILGVSSNVIGGILYGWSWNHITGLPKRGKSVNK